MTETEFKSKWDAEKAIYGAWGRFIVGEISDQLRTVGKDLDVFLKVPAKFRLKSNESLIDKAFYRPEKNYSDPYREIEDKVGVRFVVLLIEDIQIVCDIIQHSEHWSFDPCKHFDEDKEREPLLFTYQSVHHILRPQNDFEFDGIAISGEVSAEVQIRTLLQHAHAELTHDAIYKSKKKIRPSVQRTAAKSMALIETTDDFFSEVSRSVNFGPIEEHQIVDRLNAIYTSFTGITPHFQKSALTVWDEYEDVVTDSLIADIETQLVKVENYSFLSKLIIVKYADQPIRQQSLVLFLYWMLIYRRRRLVRSWPLPISVLETLATDLGISLDT